MKISAHNGYTDEYMSGNLHILCVKRGRGISIFYFTLIKAIIISN